MQFLALPDTAADYKGDDVAAIVLGGKERVLRSTEEGKEGVRNGGERKGSYGKEMSEKSSVQICDLGLYHGILLR